MTTTYTEQDWLQTPLGRYLLAAELRFYDAAVADVFGFNALQLGMPQVDLLRESRIPHRFRAAAQCGASVRCRDTQLPFATHGVDLLLLPHVLEHSESPHDTLREAARVLMPEGYLVMSGFNPVSLWGLRRWIGPRTYYPWNAQPLHLRRLKDWLALLGLEVVAGRMGCYAPPCAGQTWLHRTRWMDRAGDRWWPMLGGVYFLVAQKRVIGMRLIKPQWHRGPMVRALMPKPTQKTECQKSSHE